MSLRVLLADESSTIKKVMQLALQDFNVEVKAVPIGLDVLEVSRAFSPDIIFADVLLAKRNGYEVSNDVKSDSKLKTIPVVLMWSGFMELDETKAKLCKADRRLEKPFDADTLRGLVRDLVPRLQENLISQFLTFPNLPEIEESAQAPKNVAPAQPPLAKFTAPPAQAKTPAPEPEPIYELDEPEEFQSVPLPKTVDRTPDLRTQERPAPQDNDAWAQQDLAKFKIPVEEDDLTQDYERSGTHASQASINFGGHQNGLEEISLDSFDQIRPHSGGGAGPRGTGEGGTAGPKREPAPAPAPAMENPARGIRPGTALPSMTSISHERAEQILREQAREVLENIAWKIIPDLAERILREEIQKLMKDAERI